MMGTPSIHSMPEHWSELNAARKQQRLCADEVESLKRSCVSDCGTKHVTECTDCYGKVLERMHRRYRDSEDNEWFSQRKAFLNELEDLFAHVKERKLSLKAVEARVDSEKEAWYRWVLRKYPEFLSVGDISASRQDELRNMLDDPDRPRDELVQMMWEGIGQPANWAAGVDKFAAAVTATNGDAAELKKLYIAEFFMNQSTGQVLEHAQKYMEEYDASSTVDVEDIVDKILQDVRESRNTEAQRDNHNRLLAELRRAKTACEQNKAQAKGPNGQKVAISEELYNLPPCAVCAKDVDTGNVLSCTLCQVITQIGGKKQLTVYCSEDCYQKGHEEHSEKEHDCGPGDRCVQLQDEDVEMSDGDATTTTTTTAAVVCKECLDQKEVTIYCSERCAAVNIADHRQAKHGVKTAPEETQGLVSPLAEVVDSALEGENPGLKMSRLG